jgi:hypothetical protein
MRTVSVDQSVLGRVRFDVARSRTKFGTTEPELDERSGLPVHEVICTVIPELRGGWQPDPEVMKVKIVAPQLPALRDDQPVRFVNLRAFHWVGKDGGSGLSFSADAVETAKREA